MHGLETLVRLNEEAAARVRRGEPEAVGGSIEIEIPAERIKSRRGQKGGGR